MKNEKFLTSTKEQCSSVDDNGQIEWENNHYKKPGYGGG